jgi:2-dehydropantoate 2-reductase
MVIVQMVHVSDVLPVLSQFVNAKSFLFIGNNVNGFENTVKHLGHKNVLAGFITVGGKKKDHTVLFADADPKKPSKKAPLVLGKVNEVDNHEFNSIKQLFKEANIKVQAEDDIDGWLKTHAGMILGLASAVYLKENNIRRVAEDDELIKQIVKALRESMNVLKSLGITIVPKRNRILHLLPDFLLESVFRKLLGSEYAEIAIAGHAEAAREEMRAIADGFLVHCQKSNVSYEAFRKLTDYI